MVLITTKVCAYDHHFPLTVQAPNKMCELGSTQKKKIPAKPCKQSISLDVSAEFTVSANKASSHHDSTSRTSNLTMTLVEIKYGFSH